MIMLPHYMTINLYNTNINPIERTYASERSDTYLVDGFIPLWGSIQLDPQEQVTGMLIFEVPESSIADQQVGCW